MFGLIISVIATVVAFGLMVASLATPAWLTPGLGVFISCLGPGLRNCVNTFGDDSEALAVAVLGTTSAVFLVVGFVIFCVFFCQYKREQAYTAAVLYIFAAILAIVAGALFAGFFYDNTTSGPMDFGYSFYLCWVSGAMSIVAVIFTFIAGARKGN